MKFVLRIVVAVALFAPLSASAQQTTGKGQKTQGVLQIGEITIVGRVQKPVASVDVLHVQPKLTLAELKQPFLDRIEEASRREPF